jgi:general secretion pathway protein J
MTPTLVASRTALPPEGAKSAWGGPARILTPTLVASRTALPPEGAKSAWGGPARIFTPTLVASRTALPPSRQRGFTLIELLVAIGILALMAGLSWRGLDGMARAQTQLQRRADTVMTLQAGLSQWAADLDALVQLPNTPALDWDGRALRITRRPSTDPGAGVMVVAWTRSQRQGVDQWLRWQSAPVSRHADWQTAWTQAAQWAQNPSDTARQQETALGPLGSWQVYFSRGGAWSNPLSSAASDTVPDGVRLVLSVPAPHPLAGTLTRDWARPTLGGSAP